MPTVPRNLLLAAAVLWAALLPSTAAVAQDPVERLGLSAVAGFDGLTAGAAWLPVTVTVAPDRLFAGRLEVIGRGLAGEVVEERQVEVAGGGRKVFRFLLPAVGGAVVRATPLEGGDAVTVRPRARQVGSRDLLVGVLGGVPDGAPPVETRPTALTVTYAPVDPAWLELSPRALQGVGALVAPAGALADLAEPARRHLTDAVRSGLELVVAADGDRTSSELGGAGLPPLPASAVGDGAVTPASGAWTLTAADLRGGDPGGQTSSGGAVLVAAHDLGRGRSTVVAASLGVGELGRDAGLWARILAPGAHRQYDQGERPATSRTLESVQQVLSGGRLALPSLPWLAGFLLAYVLVVGPVNGAVLSRWGRRELAWATVPAITVVFAGGAFVAAGLSAPPTGLSARLAYWIDDAGTDLAVAAVRAPTPGDHVVAFEGPGWDVAPTSFGTPARVRHDRPDTEARFDLRALEVGLAVGWRPTTDPAPLEVDAVARGDGVQVTVRNVGAVSLDRVHVRGATERVGAGRLDPGQATTVTVGRGQLRATDPWHDEEQVLVDRPDGRPDLPTALEHVLRFPLLDRAPGLVWAVGTVADGHADDLVTVDGRAGEEVGALVAVAAAPRVDGEVVSPFAVRRSVAQVSGLGVGEAGRWQAPTAIEGVESVVLRYRLPQADGLRALTGTLETTRHGFGRPVDGPVAFGNVDCQPGATCEEHHTECDPSGCVEITRRVSCDGDGRCRVEEERCEPDGSCATSLSEGLEAEVVAPGVEEAPPEPRPGPSGVEVWDDAAGAWVALAEAFADGQADPARFVSPLGEVHVRIRSAGPLVDYSGRGIGAIREGTA